MMMIILPPLFCFLLQSFEGDFPEERVVFHLFVSLIIPKPPERSFGAHFAVSSTVQSAPNEIEIGNDPPLIFGSSQTSAARTTKTSIRSSVAETNKSIIKRSVIVTFSTVHPNTAFRRDELCRRRRAATRLKFVPRENHPKSSSPFTKTEEHVCLFKNQCTSLQLPNL